MWLLSLLLIQDLGHMINFSRGMRIRAGCLFFPFQAIKQLGSP